MHRSHGIALPRAGLLIALVLLSCPALATAQEPTPVRANALIVPINGTVKLQMSKKQKIKVVTNPKENVVTLRTLTDDPTTILVQGQQPDVTRIELEDTEGNKEVYEVIVQADIEYLRSQMRRAVPTANVTTIPLANNTVILTGTVTRAEDASVVRGLVQNMGFKYVDGMRVGGVQQVQLDVIVAQVSRSDIRNLIFNFIGDGKFMFGGSTIGNAASNPLQTGVVGGPFSTTASTLAGAPGATTNLLFGVLHNGWGLQNFLEALKQNNLAKLLAEPRLVTLSGRPASFLVGGQQAVPQTGGLGVVGVQFVPFGTQLNFIPIVLGNGRIHLEVMPEVSSLDQGAGTTLNGAPVAGRAMSMVNTTVELESGQTLVIGGFVSHTVQNQISKVPCLGDLPYLGTLFRSVSAQDQEQEVLVIVTPWLIDAESCNQRPKILPGEETRRPDDFELFLEGIIEAPRGPRQAWQNHHYVPAWVNSPSATAYPCAGKGNCGVGGACGAGNCGNGGCAVPAAGSGATEPATPSPLPAGLAPAPMQTPTPAPTNPAQLAPTVGTTIQTVPPPEAPLRPVPSANADYPPSALNDLSARAPEGGNR